MDGRMWMDVNGQKGPDRRTLTNVEQKLTDVE
jgi:hypothetical protein